ncbi:MAG: DUF5067 domain-containing protein [Bifidobacteriaceae bacterium]|jgi:hypothetical protein|nr:DUF5067 domain-containing protein [Bifidobacteriaceae bacterium]
MTQQNAPAEPQQKKKPIYKRIWFWILVVVVVAAIGGGVGSQQKNSTSTAASSSTTSKDAAKSDSKAKSTAAEGEGDVDNGNYHVKLISAKKSVNDYNGKPTVALKYEITNKQDKNSNFLDLNFKVFQNKKSLETAIYMDKTPEGYNAEDSMKELQPGGKMTIVQGYVLNGDSTTVDVEVEGTVDLSSGQKIAKTFKIQ